MGDSTAGIHLQGMSKQGGCMTPDLDLLMTAPPEKSNDYYRPYQKAWPVLDPFLSKPPYAQGNAEHRQIGVSIRYSGIGLKQKRHQTKNW
jgi:hypothetical protein